MKWIACKDQMPEEGKAVLLCDQDGSMSVAQLEDGKFYFESIILLHHEFTHWMPLPEPPKSPPNSPHKLPIGVTWL